MFQDYGSCPIACVFCRANPQPIQPVSVLGGLPTSLELGRRLIDGLQTDTLPMLLGYEMAFLT